MKRLVVTGSLVILIGVVCSSWGFLVHRTIHQLAIYELPLSMQYFFHRNMKAVVQHSVRPDKRRNKDRQEAAKHFIDLEMYGDSAAWRMPLLWKDALKKYGKDSLTKWGYVPYYIITMKEKLTAAFRSGNKDSMLFYATDIGHYISDAHVPLHVTENYDGQLTDQKGMHSLWESMIPELEIKQYDLRAKHKAKYLKHPEREVWKAVRQSYKLLSDVFAEEKAVTKTFTEKEKYRVQMRNGKEYKSYTSAFARAYSAKLGKTINKRLISSANMVADFWYTSWVDAGCPNLNKGLLTATKKQERAVLHEEIEAFKQNKLLEKQLLLAKQQQEDDEG